MHLRLCPSSFAQATMNEMVILEWYRDFQSRRPGIKGFVQQTADTWNLEWNREDL